MTPVRKVSWETKESLLDACFLLPILKTEAVRSSKTQVNLYLTIRHHIREHRHSSENLNFHIMFLVWYHWTGLPLPQRKTDGKPHSFIKRFLSSQAPFCLGVQGKEEKVWSCLSSRHPQTATMSSRRTCLCHSGRLLIYWTLNCTDAARRAKSAIGRVDTRRTSVPSPFTCNMQRVASRQRRTLVLIIVLRKKSIWNFTPVQCQGNHNI